jgi:hypothetical protein
MRRPTDRPGVRGVCGTAVFLVVNPHAKPQHPQRSTGSVVDHSRVAPRVDELRTLLITNGSS